MCIRDSFEGELIMLKKKYVKSKDEYEVTFELPSEARDAMLVCEANGWQPVEMKKSKGAFTVKMLSLIHI